MREIVFVISYSPLGRILRRLKTATSAGSVAIIFWNRLVKNRIENKIPDTIEQIEISQQAAEGNPLSSLKAFLIFSVKAFIYLINLKPKVIHTEMPNMLFIAVLYKVLFSWRVGIIYEVSDLHSLLIDKQEKIFRMIVSKLLFILEKLACRYVKLLIITSEYFYDEYYYSFFPKKKALFFPNAPEKGIFNDFQRKKEGKFTVGFIGYVRYKDQLEMLIRVSQVCDINIFIAGVGKDYQYIYNRYNHLDNVSFYGSYEYEKDIRRLYEMVDCVFSVYDASLKNVRVALPNKLYESIVSNLPIIVAENTKLAELVNKWGVGIAISHRCEDELLKVVLKLKSDKEYYDDIISNCRIMASKIDCQSINNQYIMILKTCL